MARSHAKILVQVWRDEDWRDLSMPAQWLYWVLLSQPKLTLVGSLEVTPTRWTQYANGLTPSAVSAAFDELIAGEWVLLDEATDELLIRTFTTHDLDTNRVNINLAKGLWGQWACIESADLRSRAVQGMPDKLWEKIEQYAPDDAKEIRRSARLEREDDAPFEPEPPAPFEPPLSSHLSTDNSHRPADDEPGSAPVDNLHPLAARAASAPERLRSGYRLSVVCETPKGAAGGMSVPVPVSGALTNGEAS